MHILIDGIMSNLFHVKADTVYAFFHFEIKSRNWIPSAVFALTWKRFYMIPSIKICIKEVFYLLNYTTSEWQCPNQFMFKVVMDNLTLIVGFVCFFLSFFFVFF